MFLGTLIFLIYPAQTFQSKSIVAAFKSLSMLNISLCFGYMVEKEIQDNIFKNKDIIHIQSQIRKLVI